MEKWIQEQSFEGIYIKMADGAKTPVANVAVPIGWKNNTKWKAEAERKSRLITASPTMHDALLKVKAVMDLTASKDDVDNLYYIVENALKEASK